MSHYYLERDHGKSECYDKVENVQLAIIEELSEGLAIAVNRRDMELVTDIVNAMDYFAARYGLGIYERDCSYQIGEKSWTVMECHDYSCRKADGATW